MFELFELKKCLKSVQNFDYYYARATCELDYVYTERMQNFNGEGRGTTF